MDDHTRLTLLLARVLISDPGCWTAGVLARDRSGRPVSPLDDSAVAWCARGAIYRVVGGDIAEFWRAVRALEASSQAVYGASICTVNDGPRTFAHASVLGAFDDAADAIAVARQARALATCLPDTRVDVLRILGLASRSARQAASVDLEAVGPGRDDAPGLMEEHHVATVPART